MNTVRSKKPQRRLIGKIPPKYVNDVYFNPRKREEIRQTFVESRDSFNETVAELQKPNLSEDDEKARNWAKELASLAEEMINVIDNAVPRNLKKYQLTNSFFKLFKKQNSRYLVIKSNYDKGIPKRHYLTYLLIPYGLPKKGKRTKARMIRGNYDLKGFDQIDSGAFTQIMKSFVKVNLIYKGESGTLKVQLTQRGRIIDDCWLKVIS